MIGIIIGITLGIMTLIFIVCLFAWYRIVDPSEAHLVVTPKGKFVASSDEKIGTQRTYFAIPNWIPFIGRAIRIMDVTIKELPIHQETIEKNQARYNVKSSTKYRIVDVKVASETYIVDSELQDQLKENIKSAVRAITVQYEVFEARAEKRTMEQKIRKELDEDLAKWGLELINFQLVEFEDTKESKIISDISLRSEVEVKAKTRELNAEKNKQAKIKEAEADEKAREREIARDKVVGEKEEIKKQAIAKEQKTAEEKRYEVVKVQTIKQAEINKEQAEIKAEQDKAVAIIIANQEKEAEEINKKQKQLAGEGDKLKAEEIAKGEAAPIKEKGNAEALIIKSKGIAEAEAKEKLQLALNKFGDKAIRALVAEKIVEKDKIVGVATAEALQKADVKVFSGGGKAGEQGFELGKMIESMGVSNSSTADAVLNKMARPNDMGMTALGIKSLNDTLSNDKSLNDTLSNDKSLNDTLSNDKSLNDTLSNDKSLNDTKQKIIFLFFFILKNDIW